MLPRCSELAAELPMAGSAAEATAYLLLEHPGPWAHQAVAGTGWPEEVQEHLADPHRVRLQLIRRPGRAPRPGVIRAFAVYADPVAPRAVTTELADPAELLGLDLEGLAAGHLPDWAEHAEPLYLVCTNGRRDQCCALQGRPIALALAADHPDETWETTHLGGHRFAGTMLLLPGGWCYGRLDPEAALDAIAASERGDLVVGQLRGRTAYPSVVQAAEIALRERLGCNDAGALTVESVEADSPEVVVIFRVDGERHPVRATPRTLPPARLSCADERGKPATVFDVHPA